MAFDLGLGHLVLFDLKCLGLVSDPLLSRLQRRIEFVAGALLMPVGADKLLSAVIGIERPMVNHTLEAVFLNLRALLIYPGPRGHLQDRLDLWRAPVYQGLALWGLN